MVSVRNSHLFCTRERLRNTKDWDFFWKQRHSYHLFIRMPVSLLLAVGQNKLRLLVLVCLLGSLRAEWFLRGSVHPKKCRIL